MIDKSLIILYGFEGCNAIIGFQRAQTDFPLVCEVINHASKMGEIDRIDQSVNNVIL